MRAKGTSGAGVALAAGVALLAGLAAAQAQQPAPAAGPNPSLTISPRVPAPGVPTLSEADRRALSAYDGQPALTMRPGVPIGPAYGPNDEDCVRAGSEIVCRD